MVAESFPYHLYLTSLDVSGVLQLHQSFMFIDMTSNGPVKPNETTTFSISLTKFGTETCMWVDLGDNNALLVYGDDFCPAKIDVDSINPNIVTDPKLEYIYEDSDTQTITINHVYAQDGSYTVRMNGSNLVSGSTHEMVAVVLSLMCKNPNVTIKGMYLSLSPQRTH
jgi:hypothetical protein